MSSRLSFLLPCFGVLTAVLSGCADSSTTPVSIDYRQIGFCNTYATPGGVRASKPNEVYIVYRIDSIDNAKHNADFTFLPTRLYVDSAEWGENKMPWASKPGEMQDFFALRDRRRFIANDTGFAQAMGVRGLESSVISHGAEKKIMGYSIVSAPMTGADRPAEHFYKLSYEAQEGDGNWSSVDPPVVMNNANAAQSSWPHPENCKDLALERLPS
jgi:hypothetical protein